MSSEFSRYKDSSSLCSKKDPTLFERKAGFSDCCYVSLVVFGKIESPVKVVYCFYLGSKSFEENDFHSSSDETSTEIHVKQNQRKSRIKGKPKKKVCLIKLLNFKTSSVRKFASSKFATKNSCNS